MTTRKKKTEDNEAVQVPEQQTPEETPADPPVDQTPDADQDPTTEQPAPDADSAADGLAYTVAVDDPWARDNIATQAARWNMTIEEFLANHLVKAFGRP